MVYAETKIELSRLIESGAICYQNQIGQRHDRPVQLQFTPKTKLNYCDWLDQAWSVMKTKQDNDMIDHIGPI